jgi:molybdate transport system substrate-binding protein
MLSFANKEMMRRFQVITVAVMAFVLISCAAPPPQAPSPKTLTVFAAASLKDAFTEVGKQFEAANTGVKVTFNFGGSQQLAQQLAQGAPADVFASANKKQLDVVVEAGRIVSGTARTFARNRLVVVLPKDNPAKLETLQDLARPDLKLVLAAKEVPVGQYALDFLDKAIKDPAFGQGFKKATLANVKSYEDNVKAVLTKVALGEADAGIVYASDITPDTRDKVTTIAIPNTLNTLAAYPIAMIKDAKQADLAQKFVAYVLSDAGQKILIANGFLPASQ